MAKRSRKLMCYYPDEEVVGVKIVPTVKAVSGRSLEDITKIRPTQVHYSESMSVFGMSLNDGQKVIGGDEYDCNKTETMPSKLRRIDVIFQSDEQMFHSIVFYGETTLRIGQPEQQSILGDLRGSRVESFVMEPGEELLGCEIHHGRMCTYGIVWLTWQPVKPER